MLVMSAACAASASSGNPEVRVHVQDPKGGMISNAYVVMHHEWDEQANESAAEHRQDELMRVPFDGTADFVIRSSPDFTMCTCQARASIQNAAKYMLRTARIVRLSSSWLKTNGFTRLWLNNKIES